MNSLAFNEVMALVPLPYGDPLFMDIQKKFQKGLDYSQSLSIDSIESIQNINLWKMYQSKRDVMQNTLRGFHGANERYLWHGTSCDVIDDICAQGFLRDFGTVMAYGKGIYFAKDSSYSAQFCFSFFLAFLLFLLEMQNKFRAAQCSLCETEEREL